MIDFFNVKKQYRQDREVYLDLADRVYSSGQVINGEYCRRLEKSLKQRTNRKYCVLVNSCTDGLAFVGRYGDCGYIRHQIIVFPNLSFPATNNGFTREIAGIRGSAIYLDTDRNGNLDLDLLENKIKDIPRDESVVVVLVNLFGHMIDYDRILSLKLRYSNVDFVEDAAQSFGGKWKTMPSGGFGLASTLSFDPTKNLNAFGLGGAVLTDNQQLSDAVDLHRRPHTASWINHGHNSQINEIDAAMVWWKLENRFDSWQRRRTEIAEYYIKNLDVECIVPHKDSVSAWHKFVIKHRDRDLIKNHLQEAGIQTRVHYKHTLYSKADTPTATQLTEQCLSLPIYPELTDSEVETVVDRFNTIVKSIS